MKKIAIFASGNGTNAQRIIEYFNDHPLVRVEIILSNNPSAFVLERAKAANIPSVCFNRKEFYESNFILDLLTVQGVSFIVLAGFLWLIPRNLLEAFRGRIVNIHPALLPKYGGKGMYGMKVHEAVIASGDMESGITIHRVNERYDEGEILFQATCPVESGETPETLAAKVHQLEYAHFPLVIERVLLNRNSEVVK
jgi:phosphoribosylglycinamide formyltransferase 1